MPQPWRVCQSFRRDSRPGRASLRDLHPATHQARFISTHRHPSYLYTRRFHHIHSDYWNSIYWRSL